MGLLGIMSVSGSALAVERQRAEIAAGNLANSESTRGADGKAYRRNVAVVSAVPAYRNGSGFVSGVRVDTIATVDSTVRRYEPWHPDAGVDGYVEYPDVNPAVEMADLMSADRSFQLNAAAIQCAKSMLADSLEIAK